MPNYYGADKANENIGYGRHLGSLYQPQDFSTAVGSGGDINSILVHARSSEQPWPVSRLGDKLQHIHVKAADYGGWLVYVLEISNQIQPKTQILTTIDKLEQIRQIFGLSLSHLAKALLTSRPSLHSWLEGIEPRDQSVKRINQIFKIALQWKNKSIFHYSPDRLMRQPLGDEPSMLQRLERDKLNMNELQDGLDKLQQLMQRQRDQMDQVKHRSAKSTLSTKEKEKTRHALTRTVISK